MSNLPKKKKKKKKTCSSNTYLNEAEKLLSARVRSFNKGNVSPSCCRQVFYHDTNAVLFYFSFYYFIKVRIKWNI